MAILPLINMLGINIKDEIINQLAGAKDEALGKIPGYNYLATRFRRYQAKQKLQGPKTEANTVDDYEFKKAISNLNAEIGGTYNPFKAVWGLIQTILGNTKSERIVTNIQSLESYSHQYDGYRFVNDAQKCLLDQIENRISNIESLSSKYLGTNNSKVVNDSVLKALKSALTSWLEPFDKIINGEIAEIAKPSEADLKLLTNLRDRIQYSSGARYIEDLLPRYDQLIVEAKRAIYNKVGTTQLAQPATRNRRAGQNLARTAA